MAAAVAAVAAAVANISDHLLLYACEHGLKAPPGRAIQHINNNICMSQHRNVLFVQLHIGLTISVANSVFLLRCDKLKELFGLRFGHNSRAFYTKYFSKLFGTFSGARNFQGFHSRRMIQLLTLSQETAIQFWFFQKF